MTREELRDYVDEQRGLGNIPYHVYSTLIDGIDTLEQEPKTGHWIFLEENKYGIKVKCSECGAEVYCVGEKCPRCESKMEVSE